MGGLVSLALTLSIFVVQVPLRDGSHNVVRIGSGTYAEMPVAHQTYFQKYGISELLLVGLGLVLVIVVHVALRTRTVQNGKGAGRLAWGLSVACLLLGVVGSVTIAPYLLVVGTLLVFALRTVVRGGVATERADPGGAAIRSIGTV